MKKNTDSINNFSKVINSDEKRYAESQEKIKEARKLAEALEEEKKSALSNNSSNEEDSNLPSTPNNATTSTNELGYTVSFNEGFFAVSIISYIDNFTFFFLLIKKLFLPLNL